MMSIRTRLIRGNTKSLQQVGASHGDKTVGPVADQNQQVMVGVGGHEITGPGDLPSEQGSGDLPMHPPSEQTKEGGSGDLQQTKEGAPSEQGIDTIKNSAASQHLRILIDWDELSDKMVDLRLKCIKNFWLCGRIENDKLFDMVLEREQPEPSSRDGQKMVVA